MGRRPFPDHHPCDQHSDLGTFTLPTGVGDFDVSDGVAVYIRNNDVFGFDLETHQEFSICTNAAIQWSPRVGGDWVVWTDARDRVYPSEAMDIYAYNMKTKVETHVAGPYGQVYADVSDGVAV